MTSCGAAIDARDGTNLASVTLSAGDEIWFNPGDNRYYETVIVLSGPRPDDMRMVDVQWGDKKLVMFYEDIQKRGEQVKGKPA